MSEITIKSDIQNDEVMDQAGADGQGYTDTYTAEVQIKHWDSQIGDVSIGAGDSQTVATTTAGSVKAKATIDGKEETSAALSFTTDSAATITATVKGTSLVLTKSAAENAGVITFFNQSAFPVQFLFTPADGSTQSTMLQPGLRAEPLSLASQWQASGTVKDKRQGTDPTTTFDIALAAITFDDENASIAVIYSGEGFALQLSE